MPPFLISAALLAALGAPAPVAAPSRVYILPAEDAATRVYVELIASEVSAQGYVVVTSDDVEKRLDLAADREVLACNDSACLATLADAADVDLVLQAKQGEVGRSTLLSLTLFNTETGTAGARVAEPIDPAAPDEAVKALVTQLFSPRGEGKGFVLPSDDEALRFAVLDLDAVGIEATLAKNLTQVLSAELKTVPGATVIGRDDIQAMLAYEGERAALGCNDDTSCLAELGDALGVARLVVGQVGQIAESYVVSLRLIRTDDVVVENRITETFRGSPDMLVYATRHALRRLVGLSNAAPGSLLVSCDIADATLFVDGREHGTLPGPPVPALTPGRHDVRVSAPGYYEYSTDVFVAAGESVTQWVELAPLPTPFYGTWWFWSAVGGAGAAAFVSTATLSGAAAVYFIIEQTRPRPLGPFKVTLPQRTEAE